MPILYLLVGVQGAGKTTWARSNAARLKAEVLSSDAIRNELEALGRKASNGDEVFAIFHERLREMLAQGSDVIADATHARRAWRRDALAVARRLGAKIVAVWFEVPLDVCLQRNASRRGGLWGERAVPESFLRDVWRHFERPGGDEVDEVWKVTA